jgi:hypothetical protein
VDCLVLNAGVAQIYKFEDAQDTKGFANIMVRILGKCARHQLLFTEFACRGYVLTSNDAPVLCLLLSLCKILATVVIILTDPTNGIFVLCCRCRSDCPLGLFSRVSELTFKGDRPANSLLHCDLHHLLYHAELVASAAQIQGCFCSTIESLPSSSIGKGVAFSRSTSRAW